MRKSLITIILILMTLIILTISNQVVININKEIVPRNHLTSEESVHTKPLPIGIYYSYTYASYGNSMVEGFSQAETKGLLIGAFGIYYNIEF